MDVMDELGELNKLVAKWREADDQEKNKILELIQSHMGDYLNRDDTTMAVFRFTEEVHRSQRNTANGLVVAAHSKRELIENA